MSKRRAVTHIIRPTQDVFVGRDPDGVWKQYAAKGIDLLRGTVGACTCVGRCDDGDCDTLDKLLKSGLIECVSIATPSGVVGFTKRV